MPKSKESLKEIYALIVKILEKTTSSIRKDIKYYRSPDADYHQWTDDDFLELMAEVIFAAVPPHDWDKLKPKLGAIKKAFSNFNVSKVVNFTKKDVERIMKMPEMVHNRRNIEGIIQNAKKMQEIIQEYGSFKNFICYYPYDLKQKLVDTFYGLGEQTVLDFMKEMGFPVIKDDEHIRRVFYRLGLTGSEDVEQEEILKIGRKIAAAVGEKMPVIDCVFWSFGHYICKAREPDCEECYLTKLCKQK
jgi:3-methyladenine DNA glycosylase Tag